jgi:ABC-type Na+ transport system ATPase subunit NatA
MNELWYNKLGFSENPFCIKPAAFNDELIAYDLSYIYGKIKKSEILFLEGEYGTGKTTILKNIIRTFKGKNKIIYYNFDNGDNVFDLNGLIDGANSIFRKISGLKVKDIIMLLDEVHYMKTGDSKKLAALYKEGTIKSIVFVSHDYSLVKFSDEYKSLLSGNIIRTISLNSKEAVSLIRKRIGGLDMLPDRMISKIFAYSGKNPRRLLEFCEDVTKYAVSIGDEKVTDFHINQVLGKVVKQALKEKTAKPQKDTEVKKETKAKKEIKPQKVEEVAEELGAIDIVELKEPSFQVKKAQPRRPIQVSKTEEKIEIEEGASVEELNDAHQKPLKEKKFKINKLVTNDKKDSLGTIEENHHEESEAQIKEEVPEYKAYFMEKE